MIIAIPDDSLELIRRLAHEVSEGDEHSSLGGCDWDKQKKEDAPCCRVCLASGVKAALREAGIDDRVAHLRDFVQGEDGEWRPTP